MKDEYEIYLRPLREEDAKTSWRWRNDPRVWANTESRPDCEVTEAMEREWIRKVLTDPTRRNFAIILKNDDRYIGNAYLTDIQRGAHIGLFIAIPELWGKGIGSRVHTLLHQIARDDLGLTEIKTTIRIANVGSLKAALKAGSMETSRDDTFVYLKRTLCAAPLDNAKG